MSTHKHMRENIQEFTNINTVINSKIDEYRDYIIDEDDEMDYDDLQSLFLDFLIEMRTDNNLLNLAIRKTKQANRVPEDLKKLDSRALKLELLKVRY